MCREMKRTIPKSLVQRQEKTRKDTVEMVTQAILVLESQGYNIKIKDLISVTGLSRSVFAKPHIFRTFPSGKSGKERLYPTASP